MVSYHKNQYLQSLTLELLSSHSSEIATMGLDLTFQPKFGDYTRTIPLRTISDFGRSITPSITEVDIADQIIGSEPLALAFESSTRVANLRVAKRAGHMFSTSRFSILAPSLKVVEMLLASQIMVCMVVKSGIMVARVRNNPNRTQTPVTELIYEEHVGKCDGKYATITIKPRPKTLTSITVSVSPNARGLVGAVLRVTLNDLDHVSTAGTLVIPIDKASNMHHVKYDEKYHCVTRIDLTELGLVPHAVKSTEIVLQFSGDMRADTVIGTMYSYRNVLLLDDIWGLKYSA
jgi:hypothetical protein